MENKEKTKEREREENRKVEEKFRGTKERLQLTVCCLNNEGVLGFLPP